jgi:hypothetical protein
MPCPSGHLASIVRRVSRGLEKYCSRLNISGSVSKSISNVLVLERRTFQRDHSSKPLNGGPPVDTVHSFAQFDPFCRLELT